MKQALVIAMILLFTALSAAQKDIQQVDFKNFAYQWSSASGWPHKLEWLEISEQKRIRLRNGRWRVPVEEGEDESPLFSGLTLESVQYADVTGDGQTAALVVLRYDTGGTQYSHYVYIYSLAAGKPKLLAYFHSGDRAASGLYRVYGRGGKLVVELFDPQKQEGDCCSSGFVRTRYQWQGGRFRRVGGREYGKTKAPSRLPVSVFGIHR